MPSDIGEENFSIPAFCISSPLLENLSKENASKLRKLGQRYDRLLREGQNVWSRFRSGLEKALEEQVAAARDALDYNPAALSPAKRQQWQDTHHHEVVSTLERLCHELGWPTSYAAYIAPMFYDGSAETRQACLEQLFTGSSTGTPFISIAALTNDSRGGKGYDLIGPLSFALLPQLSEAGDVVIKLNLKTISARGLRQLESQLLLMKESLEAGKTYGSIAGRPTGHRKRVLDDLTWDDIALIRRLDPERFRTLRERYVEEKLAQRTLEVWAGEEPDLEWLKSEPEFLVRTFAIQAKRAERRLEANGQS